MMIQAEVVRISKSEEASLLSAVTQMLADLMQTPGMEQEFQHLYNAQQKLAQLFGHDAASVDVVLSNTLTYREAFRNDPANNEHIRQRVSQPPDFPSSPEDFDTCDCGDVDCCDTKPEEEEPFEDAVWERIEALERESVRTVERITDLHNQLKQAESAIRLNQETTHRRLDTQSDLRVRHGTDLVALRQELIELQKSVKNLKEVMGIL